MNIRDTVQKNAVKAWISANKIGTLEVATGVGKTFMFLHCLYTMPKNSKTHLFLAEVADRKIDLLENIKKYNKIFKVNVLQDYTLIFKTYQAAYKLKDYEFGLVCGDEIHFALTPQYSKFFNNNKYDALVCLSATVDRQTTYLLENKEITKGELLDNICPICYTYTISEAKQDNVSRNIKVYVICQELDSENKTIKAGSVKNPFFQTEKKAYDYWDLEHQKSWFIEDKKVKALKIQITSAKRSKLLYSLPSKINTIKEILKTVTGRSILFGNSLDSLLEITPNVISSRNTDDQNKRIREDFDQKRLSNIASFKKLLQGANLNDLDNCLIMSYYSSEKDITQRFGRLRMNGNKEGYAFILLTKNTQEEKWFESMIQNLKDFNIQYFNNTEKCLIQYKNDKRKHC